MTGDNIIRRKHKATWGFTANEDGTIGLGVPTEGKAGDDIISKTDDKEARANGGGFPAEDAVTLDYLRSLKKQELLDLAAAHEVTLDKPKGSKDEILAELVAYYEVEETEE
ncbi:hypothetical protein [Pseudomonas phage PMBT14]|uniref:Uncharacterized protein n=1 Tax=Pseudomonas phage PMBT14 TaxID=2059855 RepID=A0A2I6PI36_9CAUD|nr:hypothetical protein HWB42_gp07 [Pseudomonas phage PMBT14]AUM59725.1 hypothetical protein [Pseudomonas phage PMBT14]